MTVIKNHKNFEKYFQPESGVRLPEFDFRVLTLLAGRCKAPRSDEEIIKNWKTCKEIVFKLEIGGGT